MTLAALTNTVNDQITGFDRRRRRAKVIYLALRIGVLVLSAGLALLVAMPPQPGSEQLVYYARIGILATIAIVVGIDRILSVHPIWTLHTSTTNSLRALRYEIETVIADNKETPAELTRLRGAYQALLNSANSSLESVAKGSGFVMITQDALEKLSSK